MKPTQAAKVMAQWGEMLTGAAENLATLANVTEQCDAMELRRNELDGELKRIATELNEKRAEQRYVKEANEAETRELIQARKDTLAAVEATHKATLEQAQQHAKDAVDALEAQLGALRIEIVNLTAERDKVGKDVADLRAIIADLAAR